MKTMRDFELANKESGFCLYFIFSQSFESEDRADEIWLTLSSGGMVDDSVFLAVIKTIDKLTATNSFILA